MSRNLGAERLTATTGVEHDAARHHARFSSSHGVGKTGFYYTQTAKEQFLCVHADLSAI